MINTPSRTRIFHSLLVLGVALTWFVGSAMGARQQAGGTGNVVEQGKYTLHKFEQAIGEETYEIRRDGDSLSVKMDFKFTDRGRAVPLSATFRSAQDLTPQAFEIKGNTARTVSIDEMVTVDSGTARIRSRDKQSDAPAPAGPASAAALPECGRDNCLHR